MIRIRRAQPDEAATVTAIAQRSKAHWGYDAEFLATAAPELTFSTEDLRRDEVWVVEVDGRIEGLHRIDLTHPATLVDLWVDPAAIGSGHGRRLWDHAISLARAAGATALELDADPHAVGFYERMGARRIGTTASTLFPGRQLPRMRVDLRDEAAG
jgi:ribosomal protein S18 acetylase RimI-like enzyme